MNILEREAPALLVRWEGLLVCLLAWAAFVAIPLSLGELGLSWDALNHHIYLGWTAERPRFDRDFVAAGSQSYQFPYLYWPVYKLAVGGWSGAAAGAVLATLQVLAVPPVWMLARACMPGRTAFDVAMRWLAVALAFLSGVVLSLFDASQNDLMASIPLVWSVALAMEPVARPDVGARAAHRFVLLSGVCAGLAVAAKLSNGPLAILLPGLWMLAVCGVRPRLIAVAFGCIGTLAGFALAYGYWGMLLWEEFGNPVYPFYDHLFALLRTRWGAAP